MYDILNAFIDIKASIISKLGRVKLFRSCLLVLYWHLLPGWQEMSIQTGFVLFIYIQNNTNIAIFLLTRLYNVWQRHFVAKCIKIYKALPIFSKPLCYILSVEYLVTFSFLVNITNFHDMFFVIRRHARYEKETNARVLIYKNAKQYLRPWISLIL